MKIQGTTILSVRHKGKVAIGGDGQVTIGETAVKHKSRKVQRLADFKVVVGFAGAAADALSLMERFEAKLKDFQGNMPKAATELAKEWRTDRTLRRLESLLAVVDKDDSLLIAGSGEVIRPDDGIIGLGSGGQYAVAAARALAKHSSLSAKEIVEEALRITSEICIYTNDQITVEEV